MSIGVELRDDVLRTLPGRARSAMREGLRGVAEQGRDYAREAAPHASDSIHVEQVGDLEFIITTDSPVAAWMEYGTRPHTIRPNRARVLHFVIDGQEVWAMEVNHPGTAPRPFMKPAAERARNDIPARLLPILQHYLGGR